ncbi:hypothetical protein UC8_45440 [Roseimaritima ulvae]|uniref:Uncharacterized protein n=1 Tax=Roseimaritima ulvae TaxID=980254 RepID=A0A5B9QYN2_9BACT|nr:hypothetical protein UC8_45440 [Roseimaritima ulvae]
MLALRLARSLVCWQMLRLLLSVTGIEVSL